jgi:hypothetical protein
MIEKVKIIYIYTVLFLNPYSKLVAIKYLSERKLIFEQIVLWKMWEGLYTTVEVLDIR